MQTPSSTACDNFVSVLQHVSTNLTAKGRRSRMQEFWISQTQAGSPTTCSAQFTANPSEPSEKSVAGTGATRSIRAQVHPVPCSYAYLPNQRPHVHLRRRKVEIRDVQGPEPRRPDISRGTRPLKGALLSNRHCPFPQRRIGNPERTATPRTFLMHHSGTFKRRSRDTRSKRYVRTPG